MCIDELIKTPVFDHLIRLAYGDRLKAYSYLANVFNGDKYTDGYLQWHSTYGTPSEDFTNEDANVAAEIATRIIDYWNYNHPSVNSTIRRISEGDDVVKLHGYPSIVDREEGKQHVADKILKLYILNADAGIKLKGNVIEVYTKYARVAWNNEIIRYAASISDSSEEELKEGYRNAAPENRMSYMESILGNDVISQNLLAVYRELNGSPKVIRAYMEEVFWDQKLQYVRGKDDDFDTLEQKLQADANAPLNGTQNGEDTAVQQDDEFDTSFAIYNNHGGQFTNFMMHIGERLFNYFNSMDRLYTPDKSNGQYVKDESNRFGIAHTMDASEVSSRLYSVSHNFVNIAEMSKVIRDIAYTVPGYESFVQLADKIKEDKDFAMEVMTVFAKTVTSKAQVRVNGAITTVTIANRNADARKVQRYNLYSDLRATTINLDDMFVRDTLNKISEHINYFNSITSEIDGITDVNSNYAEQDLNDLYAERADYWNTIETEVIRLVKTFCPSIEELAILSYIKLENNAGSDLIKKLANTINLIENIKALNNDIEKQKESYNSWQDRLKSAIAKNNELKASREKGFAVEPSSFEPVDIIYAEEILLPSIISKANTIADMLLPYSVVKLQLNSPNVNGNNSSDVLNNNYITRLKKIFEYATTEPEYNELGEQIGTVIRHPALEAWGREKLKSNQYRYSTILLEQRDKDGNLISPGIFKYNIHGQVVLTEAAPQLLQTYLFDGSSYMDEGKNAQYTEMVETGYLPTAYMAYHNTNQTDAQSYNLATYLCRTPSDAPKNFMIRTIRHSTADLLIEKDPTYRSSTATEIMRNIKELSLEEAKPYATTPFNTIAYNDTAKIEKLAQFITGKNREAQDAQNEEGIKKIDDNTDPIIIRVVNADYTSDSYIFTGEKFYTKAGGVEFRIKDFVGIRKSTEGGYVTYENGKRVIKPTTIARTSGIPNYIENAIRSNYEEILTRRDITVGDTTYEASQFIINRKAKTFQILKNIFKGEMLNMALALDHYFQMDKDGWIVDGDRANESSEKVIRLKDGLTEDDNKKGYAFYHLDENGKVLGEETENGRTRYTLGGNVFHSSKFTLVKEVTDEDGNTTTQKVNYLDNLITTDFVGSDSDGNAVFHILYGGGNIPVDQQQFLHVERDDDGNIIGVKFTEAQDKAVDDALVNYITDYLEQARESISSKKSYIRNTPRSVDAITDFAINYFIWYNTSDDLFEGDIKFYKDSQTVLKRAKEIQGSGIPYGVVDYLLGDNVEQLINIENSHLSDADIQSQFAGTIAEGLSLRNGFRAVTIKNTKMTNNVALDRLKGALIAAGLSDDRATELLYGPVLRNKDGSVKEDANGNPIRRGGFTETKVNDAQSYITIQEFIRRVAAKGQLNRYMPLITKLLDDTYTNKETGDVISYNEYKELAEEDKVNYRESSPLSAKELTEFVQVQKNFYYDQYYDERYGIYVPRQIKNAEFVLIPRLIRDTELEEVYHLMQDAKIDQLNTVETSKAANEELITLWDNKGHFDSTEFKAKAANLASNYSYNFLYTQQETPQHMNAENKAGIQVVKKIIDNIPPGHPLYNDKQAYFKLWVTNIRESYENLMDELNVPRDKYGNIDIEHLSQMDKKVFFKKFREELLRVGADRNMLDYVTLIDNEPIMPAYFNNVINKFEQVAQSIFNNNITRQKLPGFHAAQVTNIGWHPLNDNFTSASYCKDLDYHPIQYELVDAPEGNTKFISKRAYARLSDEEKAKYKVAKQSAGYIEVMTTWSALGIDRHSDYYKDKTDDEIIAELEKDGLDMIMGYRIPTEGKQSVCNMKIVGFIDDAYGSTIVVPNDWVSQTGSDFDIDSVYSITYSTYTNKKGKLCKVEYKEKGTEKEWLKYIRKRVFSKDFDENATTELKKAKEDIENIHRAMFPILVQHQNAVYSKIKGITKSIHKRFRDSDAFIADAVEKGLYGTNKNLIFKDRVDGYIKILNEELAKTNNAELKEWIEELIDVYGAIKQLLNYDYTELEDSDSKVMGYYASELIKRYSETLTKYNLPTKEQFIENFDKEPERYNTREARNNKLLDIMIGILNDPTSLEENLSRSNFDDIIYWRNKIMSESQANERAGRSAYNIFDQAKYQEDATSGMTLKGMSVALDTFCSVCNTVRPYASSPIKIIYNAEDYNESPDVITSRFDRSSVSDDKKEFTIYHDTYGWSNDNRNVAGKILTAYSSQTTAHILDAIKEGAIPGVNTYTFSAYKTFVNMGADYNAAISFIMQPAVRRIIANQERFGSVFASGYGNPINNTIRDIISKDLGIKVDVKTNVLTLLSDLADRKIEGTNITYGQVFMDIWSASPENFSTLSMNSNLPLRISDLKNRINDRRIQGLGQISATSPVEESILTEETDDNNIEQVLEETSEAPKVDMEKIRNAMFDLGVVISFNRINTFASKVGSIARCCNPDKFGAKQTVFATDKVFDDIKDILINRNKDKEKRDTLYVIDPKRVDDKGKPIKINILTSIYPGIEDSIRVEKIDDTSKYMTFIGDIVATMNDHDIMESSYPTLYAYIRYSSASASTINKTIFATQHEAFTNAVKGLTSVLSGNNPKIDEDTYKDMQAYFLTYFYNQSPFIKYPIRITKKDDGTYEMTGKPEAYDPAALGSAVINDMDKIENERKRILGYGYPAALKTVNRRTVDGSDEYKYGDLVIKDLNNPTNEELEAFASFTPGQKIQFIKAKFYNAGFFNLITVDLFNSGRRGRKAGTHSLEFTEESANIDIVRQSYCNMFFNDNPLVQMAAMDIIKYAVVAEGMKMRNKGVTKVIDNRVINSDFGMNGTGFVADVREQVERVNSIGSDYRDDAKLALLYEDYLRSHKNVKGLSTLYLSSDNIKKYKFVKTGNEMIHLTPEPFVPKEGMSEDDIRRGQANSISEFYERLSGAGILYPYGKTTRANKYIRIQQDNVNTLYKIVASHDNTDIILYPLTDLEEYEHGQWSMNPDKAQQWASKEFYEGVIAEYNQDRINNELSNILNEHKQRLKESDTTNRYFYTAHVDPNLPIGAKDFDIEKEAAKGGEMSQVYDKIKTHFNNLTAKPFYINSSALTNFIFTPGSDFGSSQDIKYENSATTKRVRIAKVDTSGYNNKYLRKKNAKEYVLTDEQVENLLVEEENENIKQVIRDARAAKLKSIDTLFVVTPITVNPYLYQNDEESDEDNVEDGEDLEEAFQSAIPSVVMESGMDFMNSQQRRGEQIAVEGSEKIRLAGVDRNEASIQANAEDINKTLSKYAATKAAQLRNKFYSFCDHPSTPDTKISILDQQVQDILMSKVPSMQPQRAELINDYMKLVNEVDAFKKAFVGYEDINTDDMSETDAFYINQIKKALGIVKELPITQAVHQLNEGYLSALSGNPLIKEQAISIMDNYWKTYGDMWKFLDIAENGNPLLQVVLKDVMGDLERKRISTERYKRDFLKEVAKIKREAASEGLTIDFDKFIDEDGRIIQDCANSFIDKLTELREARNDAARMHGHGSIEHLKAKHEYDLFKAKHTHQAVKQEYYIKTLNNEALMLQYYPEVYSAYMKLHYRKLDIITNMSEQGLSTIEQDELNKIEREIRRLSSKGGFYDEDGNYVVRPRYTSAANRNINNPQDGEDLDSYDRSKFDDFIGDEDEFSMFEDYGDEEADNSTYPPEVYGTGAAEALAAFLSAQKHLNNKYFQYDSAFGFEEQLRIKLNIIAAVEERDANGIPTKSQYDLQRNTRYQEAREWIAKNARFVIEQTEGSVNNPDSLANKLLKAFDVLKIGGNRKNHVANEICREKGIYDSRGVPNASLLSDEDIARIKQAQQAYYQVYGLPEGTDRVLISSAPKDSQIYSQDFWDKLKLNGGRNGDYFELVTKINAINEKYYDERDGIIHYDRVPDTEEGIAELNELADLYQELRNTGKYSGSTNGAEVNAFIEEECEANIASDIYADQKRAATAFGKSLAYRDAWIKVNAERDSTGEFMTTSDGTEIPNRYIYQSLKPKHPENYPSDPVKQEAITLIHEYYRRMPTVHWHNKYVEMQQLRQSDPAAYEAWWKAQHVWNPYTRSYELLDCWVISEPKDELFVNREFDGHWTPKATQRKKVPNDGKVKLANGTETYVPSRDMRNPDYKEEKDIAGNYIVGSDDGAYDSNLDLNKYEKQMRTLLQTTLQNLATTEQAKRHFSKGFLPRRRKKEENLLNRSAKEAGKLIGLNFEDKNRNRELYEDLDYWKDRTPLAPMTDILRDEKLGSEKFTQREPRRKDYDNTPEGLTQYENDHAAWDAAKKEVDEKNKKVNRDLLDRDWIGVMEEFIERAGRYNAVLDNREKLYYLLNQLNSQKAYKREHGLYGDLETDKKHSTPDNPVYVQTTDEELIKSYTNLMRRILFDQWKENNGLMTNFAKHLQGYTSADYMMLNYRGGIANVTVGEVGILGEAAAKEYIDLSSWAFGTKEWGLGAMGYIRGMYDEIAYNKQDAIIKAFKVIDYDELIGVNNELDLDKYSKRVRDFMFHPQTIGEHFMQNSVLFAMLHSHKIVTLNDDPNGIGATFMNKEEYVRYREAQELEDLLSDEQKQKFKEFKENILKDANKTKDYAWWRKDFLTQFLYIHCSKKQRDELGQETQGMTDEDRKAFIAKRKTNREKYIKEFNELNDMYSQLELGADGYMTYVEGSDLGKLNEHLTDDGKSTKAEALQALFTERVRKVNNKIHGVYNKMGQAYVEKFWHGSLLMQYHKHLPMGIVKHFRARGYYNETRGTVEKGMAQSLIDFANLDIDKVAADANWSRDEANAVQALKFHLLHTFDYLCQIRATWAVIPEYEKGNIRRNLVDLLGVTAGVIGVIGLRAYAGDDDDDSGLLYNLALYEADRMASEVFLYNPIGLWTESKSLMSTPVAAESIVQDGINSIINITTWLLNPDDYNLYYKTGRFAGRNKLGVYLERRIPIWNGIRGVLDTPTNNHYYKVGSKTGSVASTVAHWVLDREN